MYRSCVFHISLVLFHFISSHVLPHDTRSIRHAKCRRRRAQIKVATVTSSLPLRGDNLRSPLTYEEKMAMDSLEDMLKKEGKIHMRVLGTSALRVEPSVIERSPLQYTSGQVG
ncbi:hypothetical protein BDZ85DRAFT_261746 [Elsinoe ampelina]|uniref:Uncharacterized protein n=1 Tax=Elsinoe ampelina TaxID=302913 RepID=A0A6A6GCT1_9PEZI|nr:hypothetical protein BDZ85DRAFT_261746 [Elsinoe ampelina]